MVLQNSFRIVQNRVPLKLLIRKSVSDLNDLNAPWPPLCVCVHYSYKIKFSIILKTLLLVSCTHFRYDEPYVGNSVSLSLLSNENPVISSRIKTDEVYSQQISVIRTSMSYVTTSVYLLRKWKTRPGDYALPSYTLLKEGMCGRISEQIKAAVTFLTYRAYLWSTGFEYLLGPCPIWQCWILTYIILVSYIKIQPNNLVFM